VLPPFIIEQIRRREERERAQRQEHDQPRLEIPLDPRSPSQKRPPKRSIEDEEPDPDRGVIILDLG
jgi:hypothetical protein